MLKWLLRCLLKRRLKVEYECLNPSWYQIKCGEIAVGDRRWDGVCISEMANGGQWSGAPPIIPGH